MEVSNLIQSLIDCEIRRAVAEERDAGGLLRSRTVVNTIRRAHPNLDVTDRELEDMVVEAASRAAVPVEFGSRPQK